MNILNDCAIDDDIIIMGYSVCVTLCRLCLSNIIGGKYIFSVKTNKTPKKLGCFFMWDYCFFFFFAVFFFFFLALALGFF